MESLDKNMAWDYVNKTRNLFLSSQYDERYCSYLLPNEYIQRNMQYLMYYANISYVSYDIIKNITKDKVNFFAEMFMHLNTCPYSVMKNFKIMSYKDVISTNDGIEFTNTRLILNLLNKLRSDTGDGREIGKRILDRVVSMVDLQDFLLHDFDDVFDDYSLIKGKVRKLTYENTNW